MVNAQMGSFILQGIGCFSSNCNWNTPSSLGFSVSWRPSFAVAVNARRTNCITVNTLLREESNGRSADNGLLDKELEFKPSFGEYLKTMESVRTGRGKNQLRTLNRSKSSSRRGKGVLRMPSLERDEENVNLGDFKGHPYQEKKSKFGKQDELYKNSGGRSARGLVQDELDLGWENDDENSSEILEGKGSSKSQRDDKLKGRAYKADSSGLGSKGMRKRHEMNGAQVEKVGDEKIGIKKGEFNKSRKGFLEKGGNDILEIERAAFKNFEAFNDITVKKPVSKMEMEERIQKLAKLLNGADIDMPEWMFSKMMRSAKIRFTDHSILRVIQILGKLGNWRRALQVLEWLQLHERFKSHKLRYIYTAALDVLGKARRPVEALNVFYAMLQQMSSYPDLVAYHCIAVTLGQAGHMKELFDVIDCMRSPPRKKFKTGALEKWDPRLEPDIIVYNAVLNACVRRKQWEGAFWVLQQLKQQSQKPSITTYGLVMEVMFVCGKYNLVHEFFWKVQKSSIPNALTYKVLVNTLWREGKTDEAVLAVQDMEKRGVVGSAALYYDLARCLCSAGRCQEALMQIEKICKVANKPLVVTYTGLIQACLDSGNIQNAAFIFNQMHEFCSPNLITCNVMLKAYLEHRMFEEAKELFGKMLGDGNRISSKSDYNDRVLPDIYTFNTMIDACNAEKRWPSRSPYPKPTRGWTNLSHSSRRRFRVAAAGQASSEAVAEDYYTVLGLLPDATPAQIKKAYYNCMKACHPDLSGDDPENTNFCMFINEVYAVLSDPVQRLVYDEIHGHALTAINPFFDDSSPRDHAFVDEFSCIGCKNCANVAPDVFGIEEDFGRARVYSQCGKPELVQQAIDSCPVDCIHWTSAAQLSLLEDEMRRVEKINVALMLSGMGSGAVDVFRMASTRWEKRQSKALEQAKIRMMKKKGSDKTESYWSNLWGSPKDIQNKEEEVKERAKRAAAAARRWREYSRKGADKPPTFKLPEAISNKKEK